MIHEFIYLECMLDVDKAHSLIRPSRSEQVFCFTKWAMCDMDKSTEFKALENSILSDESWLVPFQQSSVIQYRFTSELVNYAVYMTRNTAEWNLVPGYFQLLHPFLITMKTESPHFSKNTTAVCKPLEFISLFIFYSN
jgi:hypothetical protein